MARLTDPLLTVAEVAREMQVSVGQVAGLVAYGQLRSLDRGRLVEKGRYDVPLIRASSVATVFGGAPDQEAQIDRRHGDGPHPAALQLHLVLEAIDGKNPNAIWELSSQATRAMAETPHGAMELWREVLALVLKTRPGIATPGYLIPGRDAVFIRLVQDPLPLGQEFSRTTKVLVFGAVPFVHEDGLWLADVPLIQAYESWRDALRAASDSTKRDSSSQT